MRPQQLLLHLPAGLLLSCLFCAQPLPAQTKPYRGAEYRTKAAFTYGRFEVRMKSSTGSGMLTTFFTYHDSAPFSVANWNEIDIEILGRYHNEAQFNTITPQQVNHVQRQVVKFNPHHAFHVYAIEWTPDYVAWRVDGFEVYRQTQNHISSLTRAQKIMMNIWQPIYVDWAGSFNPAALPFYGMYDWVKYYAYTPGSGDHFTLLWADDFDNWDQTKWDRATHSFDGNNSLFTPENIVFQDGYLILCLTSPSATGYRGGAIVDQDVDPPYLVWGRAEENKFLVFFSEEVEKASAEALGHYTIPGVTIQSAHLLSGNKTVELRAPGVDLSPSYVLVVNNIKDRANPAHQMGLQFVQVANGLRFPAKINVAGPPESDYVADQVWDAFKEYGATGGRRNSRPAGTVISGTNEPAIYQTELEGLAFYQVRVPAGRYEITLMMADSKHQSAGQRVFDIYAEEQLICDDVDVIAETGPSSALAKAISNFEVADGVLDLYFKPEVDLPILSGLLITPAGATSVKGRESLPRHFGLALYPNPFNPSAKIVYSIEHPAHAELALFDLNGRLLQILASQLMPAGTHRLAFEPNALGAGVYFIGLKIDGKIVASKKAVYLK